MILGVQLSNHSWIRTILPAISDLMVIMGFPLLTKGEAMPVYFEEIVGKAPYLPLGRDILVPS